MIKTINVNAAPILPSAPVPAFTLPALSLNNSLIAPSLSLSLSPSLVPAAVLSPITPFVAVQVVNAVKAVVNTPTALIPIHAAASIPVKATANTPSSPLVAVQSALSRETPALSALYDGSRELPSAPSVPFGPHFNIQGALKPSFRPETVVGSSLQKPQSKTKVAGASALAWWRLSGVLAPLAALFPSFLQSFGSDSRSWLALAAMWVGGPAIWEALPSAWKRSHPAAAASVAIVGGAAVGVAIAAVAGWSLLTAVGVTAALGVALAVSTQAIGALKRRLPLTPALLQVDGKGDARSLWITRERFGKLMLMTAVFERGLGEKDMHSAKADSYERAVYFKRTGDYVELIARDLSRRAPEGSPMSVALADVSADATIGKAKITGEDPVTGAVSVDLKGLALQDFFHIKTEVEQAFDAPYSLDEELSSITRADAYPDNLEIGARQIYERESAPEYGEIATRLPDARRVTLSVRLSFASLPESGYRPRLADSRVGHFTTVYEDWTDDRSARPTVTLVNRWRLDKVDPSAESSPVKNPIVFWLDASVPAQYREAVRRGVLAWNEAFAKAGLLGAVEVKDAPAGFDVSDARHTVIRWFIDKDAGYAIGQTRTDPLTGEIYQATLGISATHPRAALGVHFTDLGENGDEKPGTKPVKSKKTESKHVHGPNCGHAAAMAKQAQMTLSVIEARGGMTDEEREKFVQDYITDLTLHEVGHTLGLRHNFLAKSWKDASELTGEAPLAASVMDYLPANVAPPGVKQGSFWNTKLGPYDFWAIEYAYKTFSPETEKAEIAKIAARAGEPGHAYATDEDLVGLDPDSQVWFIGRDALEWARGRIATVRELWKSLEKRTGEGTHVANYRDFVQGWRGYLSASRLASMIVGGLGYRRNSGAEAPFTPVSGARRRAALALIEEAVFSDAPFDASADLRRRLDPGRDGTVDDPWPGLGWLPYDELTLWLRQDALARLLDPDLMHLLAESVKMAPAGDEPLTPRELVETLTNMIWKEVLEPGRKRKLTVSPSRRRLQEAHLNMLIQLAYRSAEDEVPEVSALARAHLSRLSETLTEKAERKGWDAATRDHILQSANKIDSADSRYEP